MKAPLTLKRSNAIKSPIILAMLFCALPAIGLAAAPLIGIGATNSSKVPEALVHYEARGATALLVDKSECSVNLYEFGNTWQKIKTYNCTTGKLNGEKSYEGDLRTPTGLYFFSNAWTGEDLQQMYGAANAVDYGSGAFELNYPNHLDKTFYDKGGSGIWELHVDDCVPSLATPR